MSIHTDIQKQIKEAMFAKNQVKLSVVRGLVSAFTNELVAKGRKPQGELLDEEALIVIRRNVKQRKDSIEQFEKGGRKDLVESEKAELEILETYLPKSMEKDEIKKIAEAKQKELGIFDKSKIGQLMSAVMKKLKGKADGLEVKSIVENLFS
jgi:uncharacterized protein YqeY